MSVGYGLPGGKQKEINQRAPEALFLITTDFLNSLLILFLDIL